jgi:DUF4097 and DUF4098 domain-containing protein YvlB
MTWIYTVTFLGLLFANGGKVVEQPLPVQTEPAVSVENTIVAFDEKETFEQSYPFSREGTVKISNINGSITLKAWDKDQIQLSVVKSAKTKEGLADLEVKIDADQNHFEIEARYERGQWLGSKDEIGSNSRIDMTLSVPKNAILDEIGTVNGRIDLSGFSNRTKVSAVNGEVTARDLRGSAELSTVNGVVTAEFEVLNSGDHISLNTVNGEANLIIPSDADAAIRANSLNGKITNDFGLPVSKGQFVGREMEGRLGNGSAQLKLDSVNGDLSLMRKKDGKTPKAVVAIPRGDGFSPAGVVRNAAISERINREMAAANADIEKQAAIAMKAAQAEIAKNFNSKTFEDLQKMKFDKLKIGLDAKRMKFAMKWPGSVPTIQRSERSFKLKGKTKVTIEAPNCSVTVRGWEKDEVRYVITKVGGVSDEPAEVGDNAEANSDNIKIKVDGGDDLGFGDRSRLEVFVPRKTDLDITTGGEIRLDGVSGELNIRGGDGEINVRDSSGKLILSAGDADVRVLGFTGDLTSNNVDGNVYLEGDFLHVDSTSGDGQVTLTIPKDFNGAIDSNNQIEAGSLGFTKEGENTLRMGTGAKLYKFIFNDGNLKIRDRESLGSM